MVSLEVMWVGGWMLWMMVGVSVVVSVLEVFCSRWNFISYDSVGVSV